MNHYMLLFLHTTKLETETYLYAYVSKLHNPCEYTDKDIYWSIMLIMRSTPGNS